MKPGVQGQRSQGRRWGPGLELLPGRLRGLVEPRTKEQVFPQTDVLLAHVWTQHFVILG